MKESAEGEEKAHTKGIVFCVKTISLEEISLVMPKD